ncbi:helix-turn-helix domain-containing protein [Bartonella massiliensis]|uniref:helix-turn-helix domain-containing protein n=1 Tax=Bartonella massiliensis TaxID=929795 RepID=UPI001157808E|nr:helix-turn-helix transcriptional regulator [Bartonella massiliensis]
MLTSFGKILRKLRLDHSERLLDMAEKLDVSVSFLSSVEIGKRSVPVGMEEKIIDLYDLDKATASLLRKESYACRRSFTIKASDSFRRKAVGMFVRNLDNFPQQDIARLKKLLEKLGRKTGIL